jgi:hypothetical protein
MRFLLLLVAAQLVALGACGAAEMPGFYTRSVSASADVVYDAVYHSLEQDRFWVIAEPNIGMTLARNEKRWGEDYNRNGFDAIRSMVFCHPWYANQLSNQAPEALALCPFTVTLLQAGDEAVVTFARPTAVVTSGPALALVQEIEAGIVTALDRALDEVGEQDAER